MRKLQRGFTYGDLLLSFTSPSSPGMYRPALQVELVSLRQAVERVKRRGVIDPSTSVSIRSELVSGEMTSEM